jgi:hypothetical protein
MFTLVQIHTRRVVAHDPSDNFGFSRVNKFTHRRSKIGNDAKLIALEVTPAAGVPGAQFDEVDRPLKLVAPFTFYDSVLPGIDL